MQLRPEADRVTAGGISHRMRTCVGVADVVEHRITASQNDEDRACVPGRASGQERGSFSEYRISP